MTIYVDFLKSLYEYAMDSRTRVRCIVPRFAWVDDETSKPTSVKSIL